MPVPLLTFPWVMLTSPAHFSLYVCMSRVSPVKLVGCFPTTCSALMTCTICLHCTGVPPARKVQGHVFSCRLCWIYFLLDHLQNSYEGPFLGFLAGVPKPRPLLPELPLSSCSPCICSIFSSTSSALDVCPTPCQLKL